MKISEIKYEGNSIHVYLADKVYDMATLRELLYDSRKYTIHVHTSDGEVRFHPAIEPPTFKTIQSEAERIHTANKRWWVDLETGEYSRKRSLLVMTALFHSEISELLEAVRKNTMSTKIPEFTGEAEEIVDIYLRVMDYVGGTQMNLGKAMSKGREYENISFEDSAHDALKLFKNKMLNPSPDIDESTVERKCYIINRLHGLVNEIFVAWRQDRNDTSMTFIRLIYLILGYAQYYFLPFNEALEAKIEYNANRPDHKPEDRKSKHGKKF